jgi:putative flippase GtrA
MNSVIDKEEENTLSKLLQNKVLRFFLSAGIATLVDVIIYFILINYVIDRASVKFLYSNITAHEFSLIISYTCGVIINFILTKYAVFAESDLKGRKQFFRFSLIAGIGFFANYSLLRFFVELCNFLPTSSRVFSALSLGIASFYVHRLYTFKIKS